MLLTEPDNPIVIEETASQSPPSNRGQVQELDNLSRPLERGFETDIFNMPNLSGECSGYGFILWPYLQSSLLFSTSPQMG
jgi:hypothetical protein